MSSQTKRPQSKRPPSARDRLIYQRVKVGCRRQCAVAIEFKLCEGQVSRIVKRVQEWLGTQPREALGELPHAAEQRVSRHLAIARAEELYAEARRLVAEAGGEEGRGQGSGDRGQDRGQETGDRTEAGEARRMSVRLQAIKTALKASQEAYELSQSPPPPEPDPASDDWTQTLLLRRRLIARRETAEDEGRVVKSRCVVTLIDVLLELLVGNEPGIFPPGCRGPGTEYWELAQALVGSDGRLESRLQPAHGGPASPPRASSGTSLELLPPEGGTPAPDAQERKIAEADDPRDAAGRYGDASREAAASCGAAEAAAAWAQPPEVAREKTAEVAQGGYAQGRPHAPLGTPHAPREEGITRSVMPTKEPPEVGSPEWQVARARWLAEREQRRVDALRWRAAEQSAKYLEERERMERVRARNRWLDAGRVD
jgi:hypothetical protein